MIGEKILIWTNVLPNNSHQAHIDLLDIDQPFSHCLCLASKTISSLVWLCLFCLMVYLLGFSKVSLILIEQQWYYLTHSWRDKSWIQLMGHTSAGCVTSLDIPRASEEGIPQALTLLRGVGLSLGAWAPLFRGMPTGPEVFWGMPGACGLRSCAWTHLKKGFEPHSSGWWDGRQIPLEGSEDFLPFRRFVCLLFNSLSTVSGYSMLNPSF